MIVGPRYVFVSTRKCATKTLYEYLTRHYGGRKEGGAHCRRWPHGISPSKCFVFTVVRNPFARAVSIWSSTCQRKGDRYKFRAASGCGDDFEGFVQWMATRPAVKSRGIWLLRTQGEWHDTFKFKLDRCLPLESLWEEISKYLPGTGGTAKPLPVVNASAHGSGWRNLYTPGAVDAVRFWAKEDFERFGYALEP